MSDKTILIPNLRAFYDLMRQHEDIIFQDSTLAIISDYLNAAYNGCSCRKKQNEDKALEVYKMLHIKCNPAVINQLKTAIEAKQILFFHENKHLFTL